MPTKMALVDYNKCCPERCEGGVCVAAAACTRKLIKQETPFDAPMTDPFLCKACGDCVRTCPMKAIKIMSA